MALAVLDNTKGAFEHAWLLYPEDGSEHPVERGVKIRREMRKAVPRVVCTRACEWGLRCRWVDLRGGSGLGRSSGGCGETGRIGEAFPSPWLGYLGS
jgi:hypothetical protein